MAPASGETSDFAENEMAVSELGEATANLGAPGFPPYPPYATDSAPPSVAETIIAGRDIRRQYKFSHQVPARPPPKPAKPRGPKATDVKMSKRSSRAHSRCMRRHGVILTDRLEYMAKPRRRNIIYLWREHANILPPETIARLRSMLDADEPFKPDQAYEYFVNLRKTKKKKNKKRIHQIKKDMMAICDDKRFLWARNATVAFARGIQHRLSKPGHFTLADGMLRLSDLILHDICRYMRLKTPARNSTSPKARFMLEMSDKIAVWIDEIISESDDRMLMMDFDEDEDVVDMCSNYLAQHVTLNTERGPAFDILIKSLDDNGEKPFTTQFPVLGTNYAAAHVLRTAPGLTSVKPNEETVPVFKEALHKAVDLVTPEIQKKEMDGKAFKLLIEKMKKSPTKELVKRNNYTMRYGTAAEEIESAPFLTPYLPVKDISEEINQKLTKEMEGSTPSELKVPMKTLIQDVSKHLSQTVALKRDALKHLTHMMKEKDKVPLAHIQGYEQTYGDAARRISNATSLDNENVDKPTYAKVKGKLKTLAEQNPLPQNTNELSEIVDECSEFLASPLPEDEMEKRRLLANLMARKDKSLLAQNGVFKLTYNDAGQELENATTFSSQNPSPVIFDKVSDRVRAIPIENVSAQGKPHVEGGLDAKALASLNDAAMSVKVGDEAAGKSISAKGLDAKALASLNNADRSVKVGDEAAGKSTPAKGLDAKAVASLNNAEKSVKIGDEAAEKSISAKGLDAKALASLNNAEKSVKIGEEAAEKSTSAKGLDAKALASLNNDEKSVKIGDEAAGKNTSAKGLDAKALASLNNAEKSIEIGDEAAGKSTSSKGLDAKAFASLDNAEKSVKISDEAARKSISAKGLDAKALASLNNAEKSIDIGDEAAGKSTSAQGLDSKALASLNNAEKSVKIGDEAAGKRISAKGLDAKALESLNNAEKSVKIGDEAAEKGTSAKGTDPKALASLYKAEKRVKTVTIFASVKIGDEAAGKSTSAKGLDAKAVASLNYAEKSVKIVDEAAGKSTPTKENKFVMEDSSKTTEKSDSLGKQAPKSTANVDQRDEVDPDREQALQILHSKLKARGAETFYKQPRNDLTHAQASDWLSKKPFSVDKSVKESADTARLHKKFERKLSALVATSTTPLTQDAMQGYNVLAREAVISEMQNRGNEILVEVDGAAESFFYSAQRLKKAKTLDAEKPCSIQYHIVKKLEEMIKSRGSLRKLTSHIKDYIHSAGEYLSEHVTKPDKEIEAYVALLAEMEAAGDSPLVEGNIRKSYKEAVAYLRQLTSFEDQIKRDDNTLRKTIESKLGKLMANVTKTGYGKSDLDHVIHQNAVLLTSYIKLQGEKTDALKVLIEQMDKEGENVLLRHGNLRKTYLDGANILRTKNANQLNVVNADPVVSRKIQIKLTNLMLKVTPNQYRDLMDEVIQVCKCMKNVFVQCELWCEEMLRRMNRPYCTCSRHVTTQQLADVCPNRKLYLSQSGSHLFASGLQISLTDCPSKLNTIGESSQPCPAAKPTTYCRSNTTASYVLYTSQGPFDNIPTKLSEADSLQSQILQDPQFVSSSLNPRLPLRHAFSDHVRNLQAHQSTQKNASVNYESSEVESSHKFWQSPTTMFAEVNLQTSNLTKKPDNELIPGFSKRNYQPKNVFSSRTPIITTDQMFDWHSMMVSLIWNVQAWRVWIQENINKVLAYHHNMELAESWADFQRIVSTEILQWHQYSTFSLQLTIRLASKYNNKKIISPTRTTVKTKAFLESHNEMLEIIDMFSKWTQWLTVIIKETDSLLGQNLYSQRWQILTQKVKEQIKDWNNYNRHLIYFWENKFKTLISDWIPGQPGAVWVMSACGAVPSGAVAAGVCDGEVIWVARTTQKCKILPAALYPSKHCCILYTGGRTKHYTKYQVLCNARVQWVAFRAGAVPARAVRVGDVCVGRVRVRTAHLLGPVRPPRHRCHVAIFGRPFAFDCYELLVMDDDET
ncbi:unnamed protein product [Parnassius apollo]|uniref:(apollo) hypothetical protein n=1 Tax=Parnassius apollo TaxID=110799 RepID=A0A8S3WST7_PARAO|nr:unnamed protein product [Parnassius apollo]